MNTSNPANLLIAALYYILVGLLSLFSIFGVYILVRYGKSTPFAIVVSIVYMFFFLQILSQSYQTLQGLLA